MTMGIMVPKSSIESSGTPRDTPFPEGEFVGQIEEVRTRAFPDWIDPTKNTGYSSVDGEVLSIQLGSNVALDGETDVGNRKYFYDFVTRDGDTSVDAGPNIPEKSWQMQRSAERLAQLAIALGATEEVEMDGTLYVRVIDGFLDQLQSGDFNGAPVGFRIYHRNWTSKDKTKSGTAAELGEFKTAS